MEKDLDIFYDYRHQCVHYSMNILGLVTMPVMVKTSKLLINQTIINYFIGDKKKLEAIKNIRNDFDRRHKECLGVSQELKRIDNANEKHLVFMLIQYYCILAGVITLDHQLEYIPQYLYWMARQLAILITEYKTLFKKICSFERHIYATISLYQTQTNKKFLDIFNKEMVDYSSKKRFSNGRFYERLMGIKSKKTVIIDIPANMLVPKIQFVSIVSEPIVLNLNAPKFIPQMNVNAPEFIPVNKTIQQ